MSIGLPLLPSHDVKAILCADVHGYTRLMARNEVETLRRVGRMIRLVQALIGDYGGHVMNIAGDAGLCGHSFSASAISEINVRLDESLAQFAAGWSKPVPT